MATAANWRSRANPKYSPFVALGDQASYTVPGGKTVTVYDLGPMRSGSLFGDVTVGLSVPARGKTAPLEKGLVISRGGLDLAGEGMGIGLPIARYADGWHYASSASVAVPLSSNWKYNTPCVLSPTRSVVAFCAC